MKPTRVMIFVLLGIFALCGLWLRNGNGPDTSQPLDLALLIVGGLALLGTLFLLVLDFVHLRQSWQLPEPEDPPRPPEVLRPRTDDPDRVVQEAEEFVDRAMKRIRIDIDVDETPDD